MKRGEIWRADEDAGRPFVVLGGTPASDVLAVQVVAPATVEQKRGFLVLSGAEAMDRRLRERRIATAGPTVVAVGIEVAVGVGEGLTRAGVVRVALPREGKVFCTWTVTLSRDGRFSRLGHLSPGKLQELDNAMRLAAGA